MKTLSKTLVALIAGSLLTVGANAKVFNTNNAGQAYVGVKAGQIDADIDNSNVKLDKSTTYGIYGGYQYDSNVGVEVDFAKSDKNDVNLSGVKVGEYDTKTYGAYGTYKYNFGTAPVYAKGKLGIARSEVKASGTSYNAKESTTGVAGGVGLGFNATPNVALEAEYDYKSSDVNMWSIGANVKF